MKISHIPEPIELKIWMQSLSKTEPIGRSFDLDHYVVWAGNKLPKYLWDAWKQELKTTGLNWQRFMRLLRYRTDLGVMWYKGAISWQEFMRDVIELIQGPLGKTHVDDSDFKAPNTETTDVAIVGTVAAGLPILAEENIEGYLHISKNLAKPGYKYLGLRVRGDSMNEVGINDGDIVLVRQQSYAEEGEHIVALLDDEATVKEFHRERGMIILKPRSTNRKHKPIILTEDFQIQGVVVTTLPALKWETIIESNN
jgi:SOS regulatory protein LexA